MANFKEIVTKAVIGKGKKTFVTNHSIVPKTDATTVLGCWVINHTFRGFKVGEEIKVEGSYDVNIWYSCENDTKTEVITQSITYSEVVNVPRRTESDLNNQEEIIVRSLRQPTCIKVEIDQNTIRYVVEKELGIEIVGDTKVKIAIDEEEDPWDEIDSVDSETEKQIDEEVSDEFLN